jgi:hypothetical protein
LTAVPTKTRRIECHCSRTPRGTSARRQLAMVVRRQVRCAGGRVSLSTTCARCGHTRPNARFELIRAHRLTQAMNCKYQRAARRVCHAQSGGARRARSPDTTRTCAAERSLRHHHLCTGVVGGDGEWREGQPHRDCVSAAPPARVGKKLCRFECGTGQHLVGYATQKRTVFLGCPCAIPFRVVVHLPVLFARSLVA